MCESCEKLFMDQRGAGSNLKSIWPNSKVVIVHDLWVSYMHVCFVQAVALNIISSLLT